MLIKKQKKTGFLLENFIFFGCKFRSIYLNSHVFEMLVKFVVGRINGIFDFVETETRNSIINPCPAE